MSYRNIWCCGCGKKVQARLTTGQEIYPRRAKLRALPFWVCDTCGNNVGCHWQTTEPTKPLGCIATPEIKNARQHIHRILDPIWKRGHVRRNRLYQLISKEIGVKRYHTAEIRSLEDARQVYRVVWRLARQFGTL